MSLAYTLYILEVMLERAILLLNKNKEQTECAVVSVIPHPVYRHKSAQREHSMMRSIN